MSKEIARHSPRMHGTRAREAKVVVMAAVNRKDAISVPVHLLNRGK